MSVGRAPSVRMRGLVAATVIVGLNAAASADGVLDPATYTSPSGHYQLHVDPSVMNGSGFGTYTLTHGGEEVWAGERPFTLWEAAVTDRGEVLGYAYEEGAFNSGHHGTGYKGLAIYILDPEGQVRLRDPAGSHENDVSVNLWAMGDSPRCRASFLIRGPIVSSSAFLSTTGRSRLSGGCTA